MEQTSLNLDTLSDEERAKFNVLTEVHYITLEVAHQSISVTEGYEKLLKFVSEHKK
jgi:2-oxo-4-hydroxy-4-carboxy--5-ureidoimidazoline (OHCU) decarboxylase